MLDVSNASRADVHMEQERLDRHWRNVFMFSLTIVDGLSRAGQRLQLNASSCYHLPTRVVAFTTCATTFKTNSKPPVSGTLSLSCTFELPTRSLGLAQIIRTYQGEQNDPVVGPEASASQPSRDKPQQDGEDVNDD